MKKSFKVIASAAMVFSMFTSAALADTATTTTTAASTTAAATKTSKDFKDLANIDAGLAAKIDIMLAKGYMDGTSSDTFDITGNMTRAEAAKLVCKVFNIKVDDSVATSSFSDVPSDDSSISWAIPYIEAAKKAGLIDGMSDTVYAPKDNVTIGQLATLYVKGLGKSGDVKTTTPWYQGYVDVAKANGIDFGSAAGDAVATRADLVAGSYAADQAFTNLNKPAQVSVVEAKPIGVQTVQVTLDRDVDTTAAKLALTKGSSKIDTTVKWSDDKKTATLTLSTDKIRAGDYTVTLSGLDASAVKTATGTFTAQDETLQKIEFVNPSDTIAYSQSVVIKARAVNQYGENASFSSGNYTVYTSLAQFVKMNKMDDGTLALTLNTKDSGGTQGVSVIPVTIVNNDQHLTVTKNFTLGTAPILSKLELGDAEYSNPENAITGKGDTVKFDMNLFDQYGGNISYDSPDFKKSDVNVIWNDYVGTNTSNASVVTTDIEDNGSNIPRLKISLNDDVDKSGAYTFTVTDQAASAQGTVNIKSVSVATKVQIGDFDDVIAAGDQDVYIPVTAYDASGNPLSIDDLTSDTNRARIQINVSGADDYEKEILDTGAHRGSVHLKNITSASKGSVTVTLVIATPNASSTDTRTFTVADARVPDTIKEIDDPAKDYVAGSFSSFQYQILDQYGKPMDYNLPTDDNGNANGSVTYDVYASFKNASSGAAFSLTRDDDSEQDNVIADVYSNNGAIQQNNFATFTSSDETTPFAFKQFNKGLRVYASTVQANGTTMGDTRLTGFTPAANTPIVNAASGATATLHVAIRKWSVVNGVPVANEISYVDQDISAAQTNEDWTYNLVDLGTMFNTIDSGFTNQVPSIDVTDPTQNSMHKRVNLSIVNASGDQVAIPYNYIKNVTSSNPLAVKVKRNPTSGKWYALGNKTGTATLTVTYINDKGEYKTASQNVTVNSDTPTIATMVANDKITVNSSATDSTYSVSTAYAGTGAVQPYVPFSEGLTNLHITDSYGYSYDGDDIVNYGVSVYGLTFTVEHITNTSGQGTVTVDPTSGKVTIGANFKGSFDLVVYAPNGMSSTTEVDVQ